MKRLMYGALIAGCLISVSSGATKPHLLFDTTFNAGDTIQSQTVHVYNAQNQNVEDTSLMYTVSSKKWSVKQFSEKGYDAAGNMIYVINGKKTPTGSQQFFPSNFYAYNQTGQMVADTYVTYNATKPGWDVGSIAIHHYDASGKDIADTVFSATMVKLHFISYTWEANKVTIVDKDTLGAKLGSTVKEFTGSDTTKISFLNKGDTLTGYTTYDYSNGLMMKANYFTAKDVKTGYTKFAWNNAGVINPLLKNVSGRLFANMVTDLYDIRGRQIGGIDRSQSSVTPGNYVMVASSGSRYLAKKIVVK